MLWLMENFEAFLKMLSHSYNKKDDDPADKTNFSPLSSKVFERIQYNQLDKYVGTFLNKIFS